MKRTFAFIIIIILLVSLTSCNIVNEYESGIDVANKALPTVLELTSEFQASRSYATAFIIDERGYVITNAHAVTDTAGTFVYEATSIEGNFYNSKQKYLLDIIAYDIELDIAVLKFRRNDLTLKAVEVGKSSNLSYGATIFTLGNSDAGGIAMTKGIISVPQKNFKDSQTGITSQVIQFDAAVNNGSSGGPLLNIKGEVIGLISFKVKNDGSQVEGIAFAIPSSIFMEYYYANVDLPQGELEQIDENEEQETEGEEQEEEVA